MLPSLSGLSLSPLPHLWFFPPFSPVPESRRQIFSVVGRPLLLEEFLEKEVLREGGGEALVAVLYEHKGSGGSFLVEKPVVIYGYFGLCWWAIFV